MSRRFDLLRSVAQMNKTCCSNAHCLKYWNVPFLFTGLVQVRNQKSQASVHKVFHFPCFIECDVAKYKIGDISFTSLIIWCKEILSSDDLGHEEVLQHPFHDGHPLSQQLWVLFTFQSLLSPLKEEHFYWSWLTFGSQGMDIMDWFCGIWGQLTKWETLTQIYKKWFGYTEVSKKPSKFKVDILLGWLQLYWVGALRLG